MMKPDYIMINARGSFEAPWGDELRWNAFDAVHPVRNADVIVHYSFKEIKGHVKMPLIEVMKMKETGKCGELCRLALEKHDQING